MSVQNNKPRLVGGGSERKTSATNIIKEIGCMIPMRLPFASHQVRQEEQEDRLACIWFGSLKMICYIG